jgi:hypothetical protein
MQKACFSINTLSDLCSLQKKLISGESVIVDKIGQISYTIKLKGGRFDNFDIGLIDADIAEIVLSYQNNFYKIVSTLEKNYNVENIDKTKLLKFKLERGSLQIELKDLIATLLESIKNMSDPYKVIVIVFITLAILGGYSYSEYLTHIENLAEISAESENRRIIADLKSDKKLQNAVNEPKKTVATVLRDDESAVFNDEEEPITHEKVKKFEFKELADTTTTDDQIGEFTILGYEKTNSGDRKFKIDVNGIKWVSANLINADQRIKLATAIERGNNVKLKIRTVKEYGKIKEVAILDVMGGE